MDDNDLIITRTVAARGQLSAMQRHLEKAESTVADLGVQSGAALLTYGRIPPELDEAAARAQREVAATRAAIVQAEAAILVANREDAEATVERGLQELDQQLLPERAAAANELVAHLDATRQAIVRLLRVETAIFQRLGSGRSVMTPEGHLVNHASPNWADPTRLMDMAINALRSAGSAGSIFSVQQEEAPLRTYFIHAATQWAQQALAAPIHPPPDEDDAPSDEPATAAQHSVG